MSYMDEREQDVRRELTGWFTEQGLDVGWRDPVDAALARTAAMPQRRPLPRWLPDLAWRDHWRRPVGALLAVAVLLIAGAGLARIGRLAGTLDANPAPGVGGPATAAPPTLPPGPYLYWANNGISTIGVATLDGKWVRENFIKDAHFPCGVAADAAHLYWANAQDGTIGRANLDGTGIDQAFITGATSPCGIAVDVAHIYWTNGGATQVDQPSVYGPASLPPVTDATTIGRANLDGTEVDQQFIVGVHDPCGVAVDDAHVYWLTSGVSGSGGTIGRANLDGTGIDRRFISGASVAGSGACGIAVGAGYLYWSSSAYGIGRAARDGSDAKPTWLTTTAGPCGLAVDRAHLYWASTEFLGINRANLDGSGIDQYFVPTGNSLGFPYPCGVAISP